jgi:hypothetical protein
MFRCVEITNLLLLNLFEDPAVSEVILMDNSGNQELNPDILVHPKMKVYHQEKNIYVNPAWNLGVSLTSEDLIGILNDDITVPEKIFSIISQAPFENLGIMGAAFPEIHQVEKPSRFECSEVNAYGLSTRPWGFGIFMAMHKKNYIEIPEDMLVWCGDDYLFHQNAKLGKTNCIGMFRIETKMSSTSDDSIFDDIKNKDLEVYNSKYKIA